LSVHPELVEGRTSDKKKQKVAAIINTEYVKTCGDPYSVSSRLLKVKPIV
tara:strand:- start:1532 stop:1681 length:150 start_codon:yes stop_codon:yes gene_type:complete